MPPAVTIAGLATIDGTVLQEAVDSPVFSAISIHPFRRHGHGSLGSATEANGRIMVTTALGQECQCQQGLVMRWIEVHRFVKTLLGARRLPAAWKIMPIR